MAGNIIPAIATTNAIIAGLVVLQTLKVIDGRPKDCRHVSLFEKQTITLVDKFVDIYEFDAES